jgi:hypothetical protein
MMTQFETLLALSLANYSTGQWGMPKGRLYSPVSVDWVVKEALPEWINSLPPALIQVVDVGGGKTARQVRYSPEAGDCNIIATDFVAFMSRCMWRDAVVSGAERGNLAAGLMFFELIPGDPTTGHAIVWFIDHDQNAHCIDPVTREVDHLTDAQLETIMGGEYA